MNLDRVVTRNQWKRAGMYVPFKEWRSMKLKRETKLPDEEMERDHEAEMRRVISRYHVEMARAKMRPEAARIMLDVAILLSAVAALIAGYFFFF